MVDLDAIQWLTLGLGCCLEQLCVSFVPVLYFLVQFLNNFISQSVRADRNAEIIGSTSQHNCQSVENFIINLIHAQVQMFELRIFDGDPLLYFLTIVILPGDLFNIVQLWHWLLGLFGSLQLFVFLDNGVSFL